MVAANIKGRQTASLCCHEYKRQRKEFSYGAILYQELYVTNYTLKFKSLMYIDTIYIIWYIYRMRLREREGGREGVS